MDKKKSANPANSGSTFGKQNTTALSRSCSISASEKPSTVSRSNSTAAGKRLGPLSMLLRLPPVPVKPATKTLEKLHLVHWPFKYFILKRRGLQPEVSANENSSCLPNLQHRQSCADEYSLQEALEPNFNVIEQPWLLSLPMGILIHMEEKGIE